MLSLRAVPSLSLRARVLAGLAAVALVTVSVAVAITSLSRSQLIDQVDEQLRAGAEFDRTRDRDDDHHEPPPDGGGPRDRLGPTFEGYLATDGTLTVRYASSVPGRSYGLPDISLDDVMAANGGGFTTGSEDDDVSYRVVAVDLGDGWIVQARPLDEVDQTMRRILALEAVGVGVVLLVLVAVGWWVVQLGVVPIKRMTAAAEAIAADEGDLASRVPEPAASGTESAALARSLNTMLGRIETAADRQARSEQRLRRFVADASHELRTPVTTIRGYAELYRHGGLATGDALDDAMRRTEQEATRMGRLVEDMLVLAKLDQERPVERRPVDLSMLLADAAADAAVVAPDRPLTVDVEADLSVAGDEDRLRQVVANLVGNALTHTGPDDAIELSGHRVGETIEIRVADDGPGMEPEVAARVTERFFRADPSRSRERGGSGLGLAIVDAVVAAHGGTVDVESEPGRGTTVTVVLPTVRSTDRGPVDDREDAAQG